MIRFGLVGCGTHARWAVIPSMKHAADQCTLAAVADISRENISRAELGSIPAYTDYREMIAAGGLDAVYIATMEDLHTPIAVASMEAGLHVMCEKPMAGSIAECRQMIEVAKRTKRIIGVNFELRFAPYSQIIRKWIRDGHVGEIGAIHQQEMWDCHKTSGEIGERRLRAINFSGSLGCGIHRGDLVRFFTGEDWNEIEARGAWFGEQTSLPSHTSVLATTAGGIVATLNTSFAYTAFIPQKAAVFQISIVGTKGVIEYLQYELEKPGTLSIVSETLNETLEVTEPPHDVSMTSVLHEFTDLATEKISEFTTLATAEDGLQAQIFFDCGNASALRAAKHS